MICITFQFNTYNLHNDSYAYVYTDSISLFQVQGETLAFWPLTHTQIHTHTKKECIYKSKDAPPVICLARFLAKIIAKRRTKYSRTNPSGVRIHLRFY